MGRRSGVEEEEEEEDEEEDTIKCKITIKVSPLSCSMCGEYIWGCMTYKIRNKKGHGE